MKDKDAIKLGRFIARQIFASANSTRPITRLQFKAGQWPGNETDEGGLCERALQTEATNAIRAFYQPHPHPQRKKRA